MKKPSKEGVISVLILLALGFYFSYIPKLIVMYGIDNGIKAFSSPVPFHEVYSVFCAAWIFGHILLGVIILCLYMMLWGCHEDKSKLPKIPPYI